MFNKMFTNIILVSSLLLVPVFAEEEIIDEVELTEAEKKTLVKDRHGHWWYKGPNGKWHRKHISAVKSKSVEKTENGRTVNSSIDINGPKDKDVSIDRTVDWTKTEDGAVRDVTVEKTTPKGTSTKEATSTITKTDDGRDISTTGTINTAKGNTITFDRDKSITKTEDGRNWESSATRNGPNGTATREGSGSVTRDGNKLSFERNQSGTRANGTTWNRDTEGKARITKDGKVSHSKSNYNDSKGRDISTKRHSATKRTDNGAKTRSVSKRTNNNTGKSRVRTSGKSRSRR